MKNIRWRILDPRDEDFNNFLKNCSLISCTLYSIDEQFKFFFRQPNDDLCFNKTKFLIGSNALLIL